MIVTYSQKKHRDFPPLRRWAFSSKRRCSSPWLFLAESFSSAMAGLVPISVLREIYSNVWHIDIEWYRYSIDNFMLYSLDLICIFYLSCVIEFDDRWNICINIQILNQLHTAMWIPWNITNLPSHRHHCPGQLLMRSPRSSLAFHEYQSGFQTTTLITI